ncbi:Cortactin-binding protein-2 [Blomia tropicalis]|nr:Cortactin-binding protein-2 [Blomia tropicalis]
MSFFNTTLKRNSKLDLSRPDLLKLVSMLEGELQAREIAIAVLKSEQIKRLLNPPKLPLASSGFKSAKNINSCVPTAVDFNPEQTIKYSADPLSALSRDSFAVYEPSLDHSTTLALFNLKIYQLEHFIQNQKLLRSKFSEQIELIEKNYEKTLSELENERIKNSELSSDFKEYDKVKLEDEIKTLTNSLEEVKSREKQMVLSLLNERKNLIIKLIEEKHQNDELRQQLTSEKGKCAEMVEGLEDESKRSLLMEAELERNISEFETEKNTLKIQLQQSESRNLELTKEVEQLKCMVDNMQKQLISCGKSVDSIDSTKWNIGEGVRSSIVTMPVSTKVHSLSSVSAVAHPKASVAQPVTKILTQMKASGQPMETNPKLTVATNQKNDNSVKQNIMFYENSANQLKTSASGPTMATATMRKSSIGSRVPPPVPPNKPSIKPVLPSQAILHQNKIKDANSLANKTTNAQPKSNVNSNSTYSTTTVSKS